MMMASINQMAFLFTLMALGFILVKLKAVPENSESVLSKLENYLFIPALVAGTFIKNFTPDKLRSTGNLMIQCIVLEIIVIAVSLVLVRFCAKDKYTRDIYLYGLCFSNFSFMGNAIVSVLFPDIFMEYVLFTLVLWALIYLWGAPVLLIGSQQNDIKSRLKSFVNPMFICMIIGMLIGILQLPVPTFAETLVNDLGKCMSPVAMLLSGMTMAKMDLKKVLATGSIYLVTFLRILVYPFLFILAYMLLNKPFSDTFTICAVASLAMPLGLNTIVIPASYGKDTKVASGSALVSHVFAIATIPVVFKVLESIM